VPAGVNTNMLFAGAIDNAVGVAVVTAAGPVVEPDDVADAVIAGLRDERFLILTHPEVAEYEAPAARPSAIAGWAGCGSCWPGFRPGGSPSDCGYRR